MGPQTSSRRFKTDIEDLDLDTSLIYHLRPVSFRWNVDGQDQQDVGLIAEEVNDLYPEFVPKDADGLPYSVSYDKLVLVYLNEIRKLREDVDYLLNFH
jgi:hypothetical protein